MTEQEIRKLDNEVRREAKKKYLTITDLEKIKRDDKTYLEYVKEFFK